MPPGEKGGKRGVGFAHIIVEIEGAELGLGRKGIDEDQAAVLALENGCSSLP